MVILRADIRRRDSGTLSGQHGPPGANRDLLMPWATSPSRSSSPTFRLSRAAALVRHRSGREASSSSSATCCSNRCFPSREAFGSSVSLCLHSRRRRLSGSLNSACPYKRQTRRGERDGLAGCRIESTSRGLKTGNGVVPGFGSLFCVGAGKSRQALLIPGRYPKCGSRQSQQTAATALAPAAAIALSPRTIHQSRQP